MSVTVCPLVKDFSDFGGYLTHPVSDLAPQRLLFLHDDRRWLLLVPVGLIQVGQREDLPLQALDVPELEADRCGFHDALTDYPALVDREEVGSEGAQGTEGPLESHPLEGAAKEPLKLVEGPQMGRR